VQTTTWSRSGIPTSSPTFAQPSRQLDVGPGRGRSLDGWLCATMIAPAAQAMATSCRPDTDVGLFPGDCVGLPFWINPRGLCVARHLLGKAMSRARPHVRTSPVSAAHLPAQQASRLAANQANSNPAVAFIDHSLSPYCPPAAAAVRPVAPPSVGSSSQPSLPAPPPHL